MDYSGRQVEEHDNFRTYPRILRSTRTSPSSPAASSPAAIGFAIVVVPYWEWGSVCGSELSTVEYLWGKLDSSCVGESAAPSLCQAAEGHAVEVDEPRTAPAAWRHQGKPEDWKIQKDKDKSQAKNGRGIAALRTGSQGCSKKRGRTFYFNCATGESRWDKLRNHKTIEASPTRCRVTPASQPSVGRAPPKENCFAEMSAPLR